MLHAAPERAKTPASVRGSATSHGVLLRFECVCFGEAERGCI
jgi:hypothetical protein